jgi:RecA/RadA recombinase
LAAQADRRADPLPKDPAALASWLQEGVVAEVEALEKEGSTQTYELFSGRVLEALEPSQAVYQFVMADGLRAPEEATGRLKVGQEEFDASVVSQEADRVLLQLTGHAPLPIAIARGILTVDDTALLKKLAEVLKELAASPSAIGPHAVGAFHPSAVETGSHSLPELAGTWSVTDEQRVVLEHGLGSEITYVWGPPGTGKTFVIAHLVAALMDIGERVLVTSHTNAAVDASLYAAVQTDEAVHGPLAHHEAFSEGRVLRLGRTQDQRVPNSVRLDKLLESRVGELEGRIREAEALVRRLGVAKADIEQALLSWQLLANAELLKREAQEELATADAEFNTSSDAVQSAEETLRLATIDLDRARKTWLFRGRRVERAQQVREMADAQFAQTRLAGEAAAQVVIVAEEQCELRERELMVAQANCEHQVPQAELEAERNTNIEETEALQSEIDELQAAVAQAQQQLIDDARAVFCTLTKCYVGKEMAEQKFDAVVIDEISMALPPLIFLVAARAANRVILVGDFKQLAPVVRSDSEVSSSRLRQDVFHLSGVAVNGKPSKSPSLVRLRTQQRMLSPIADGARVLAYGQDGLIDHETVRQRKPAHWADVLSETPLLIVDTADLHCWSGKQPRTLSRFNFYSATIASELAAAAAARLPDPPASARRPIGIITPFAAQRRVLSRLTESMKLQDWVATGTVHTFQGSEGELIIFDSVLDEPYWSARLCDPAAFADVVRDLNVAITRARDRFLFVGSSEWLNKHAKSSSALGKLWPS